jgi:hypothetical protein
MKRISRGAVCASAMVLVFGAVASAQGQGNGQGPGEGQGAPEIIVHRTNPHGAGGGAPTVGSTGVITPQITYHFGPLLATPSIYYIFYGNWNQGNGSDNAGGKTILEDFARGVGGTDYFEINTSYIAGGVTITGNASYWGSTTDNYSRGSRLRDADILTIVNSAINGGRLPYDANGVYFVLTSSDVNEQTGFCTKYCGWHTAGNTTHGHVRYSFVGNANRCLNACAEQTTGPNGNAGVDGMVSVVAHELEEATTDPDPGSGWVDSNGAENADKCAWTFGSSTRLSSGAYYNMSFGGRNWLIQRNLVHNPSGDVCKRGLNASQP